MILLQILLFVLVYLIVGAIVLGVIRGIDRRYPDLDWNMEGLPSSPVAFFGWPIVVFVLAVVTTYDNFKLRSPLNWIEEFVVKLIVREDR